MDTAYKEALGQLDQIRSSSNNPAIERACDKLEIICRSHLPPPDNFLSNIHFTPAERRMLDLMRHRLGRTVRKDALLDAIEYSGQEQANPGSLGVMICRIRSKLWRYNAPFHIETEARIGYRLEDGAKLYQSVQSRAQFHMESRAA